jgi:hypothetical protein
VLIEHELDLGGTRPALYPRHDSPLFDQNQGGRTFDLKALD